MSKPIVFGTMVVDKLHMFFGKSSPSVAVVADMWNTEEDDEEVWVDHYRAHSRVSYEDLRNSDKWEVLDTVDLSSELSVHDQCKQAEKEWEESHQDFIDARTAENGRLLKERKS